VLDGTKFTKQRTAVCISNMVRIRTSAGNLTSNKALSQPKPKPAAVKGVNQKKVCSGPYVTEADKVLLKSANTTNKLTQDKRCQASRTTAMPSKAATLKLPAIHSISTQVGKGPNEKRVCESCAGHIACGHNSSSMVSTFSATLPKPRNTGVGNNNAKGHKAIRTKLPLA
jgi:hypothetical protein